LRRAGKRELAGHFQRHRLVLNPDGRELPPLSGRYGIRPPASDLRLRGEGIGAIFWQKGIDQNPLHCNNALAPPTAALSQPS
jgi:hypothetical protein